MCNRKMRSLQSQQILRPILSIQSGKINENDLNIEAIKSSEIIFLEGYLWDEGDAKKAFDKWKETSKEDRIALLEKLLIIYKKRFNI